MTNGFDLDILRHQKSKIQKYIFCKIDNMEPLAYMQSIFIWFYTVSHTHMHHLPNKQRSLPSNFATSTVLCTSNPYFDKQVVQIQSSKKKKTLSTYSPHVKAMYIQEILLYIMFLIICKLYLEVYYTLAHCSLSD